MKLDIKTIEKEYIEYFTIYDGEISSYEWKGYVSDFVNAYHGNMFKTREEAEKRLAEIKRFYENT